MGLQSLSLSLSSTRTIESATLTLPPGGSATNTGAHATASVQKSMLTAENDYVIQYVLRATELGLFSFSTKPSDTLGFFTFMVEPDPSTDTVYRGSPRTPSTGRRNLCEHHLNPGR